MPHTIKRVAAQVGHSFKYQATIICDLMRKQAICDLGLATQVSNIYVRLATQVSLNDLKPNMQASKIITLY